MLASIQDACREVVTVPGVQVVEEALGDLIYLNVWLLGIAYQKGLVPLCSRGDQPGAGAERGADRAQQGGLRAGPRRGAGAAAPR